jgi:hypothetical protein
MDEDLTGELWPGRRRRKNQGRRGALISWQVVNAERRELIPGALCCPPAAVADLKRHCFAILAGAHGAKNGSTSAVFDQLLLQTVIVFIALSASVWLV